MSLCLSAPSTAIVTAGDPVDNATRPPDGAGWSYVGRIGGLNGVYLGHGWGITAAHVAHATKIGDPARPADFQVAGGKYPIDPESVRQIEGRDGRPDLALFRTRTRPALPPLVLASSPPEVGREVRMIGRGRDREAELHYWNARFEDTAPEHATHAGFALAATHTKRWGSNRVVDRASLPGPKGTVTQVFATRFEPDQGPRRAQVTSGDSGGGVFCRDLDGRFELCGVSIGASSRGGRDRVLFGAVSFIADLSHYRDEIERFTNPPKDRTPGS